jgi:hypothetical protein
MTTKKKKTPPAKNKPIIADSIARAAAIMNIDVATIRAAKVAGADGFRGHRINVEKLAAWMKKHPAIAKASIEATARKASTSAMAERKLKAATELLEHRLMKERGEVIAKSLVVETWAAIWAAIEDEAKGLMDKAVFPVFVSRVKARNKSALTPTKTK